MNGECRTHKKTHKIFFRDIRGYLGISGSVKVGPKVRSEQKWILTFLLPLFLGVHMFSVNSFVLLSRRQIQYTSVVSAITSKFKTVIMFRIVKLKIMLKRTDGISP
jgi:hypothetical protein